MDQLREPLRVAVVGRVKAGKSTLVNALVGMQVAPTAATECTQVVTWYRHGNRRGAQLMLRDGTQRPVSIVDGFPETLGVPFDAIDHLEVELPSASLKSMVLIDTPGLVSLTRERGEATRAAVLGERASLAATGQVDALVFVFRDVEHEDEMDFLRVFKRATGSQEATTVNTVGVLSHADLFGGGPFGDVDPLESAASKSAKLAREHATELADVVAVAGLLGETCRTGRLTEDHARSLAALSELDDTKLRLSIASVSGSSRKSRLKPHQELGVSDAALRSLLWLIGPYGVLHARSVAQQGASSVYRWADERVGIGRLERLLAELFTQRADVLKASRSLAALGRLSNELSPDSQQRVADTLEEVWMEPLMHRIYELRAVEALRQQPSPDQAVLEALELFVNGAGLTDLLAIKPTAGPSGIKEASLRKARWAQEVSASSATNLELQEASRVLSHSYLLLSEEGTAS